MTHPLTDEILSQFGEPGLEGYEDERLFFADDMRAAYDRGSAYGSADGYSEGYFNGHRDGMEHNSVMEEMIPVQSTPSDYDLGRDAQLEQVVKFASNYTFLAFRDSGEKMAFIDRLKEAMRPNS